MSSPTQQKNEVKRLYELALQIIDERNLYNAKTEIEHGVRENFGEYVIQNVITDVYEKWWTEFEHGFSKVGLNFLRFKKKILQRRPSQNHSMYPPGYFLTAVIELEAIIANDEYLEQYRLSPKTIKSWPTITYKNGVVSNGVDHHDFNISGNEDAIRLLDHAWEAREIISPTKELLRESKDLEWHAAGFNSAATGKATAHSINRAMRLKDINLRVKHPFRAKDFYIQVQQKGTK